MQGLYAVPLTSQDMTRFCGQQSRQEQWLPGQAAVGLLLVVASVSELPRGIQVHISRIFLFNMIICFVYSEYQEAT
jgi:amino acid permease